MTPSVKKHTTIHTLLLHLIPGLINLLAIILLLPLTARLGYAENGMLLASQMTILFVMFPTQIGFLLFVATKTTNTYNIRKLMPFQEKSKFVEYLLFLIIMIIWDWVLVRSLRQFRMA